MLPSRSMKNVDHEQWLQQPGWKIHKVPPLIRRDDRHSGAYDPKVVSFGPYHHGKPELETCQQVKRLAQKIFVEGSNKTLEYFRSKVLEVISDARNLYVHGSTDQYSDEEFADMMLLDSCFLIYLIYMSTIIPPVTQSHTSFITVYLQLGNLAHHSINHDILLMENQIPFQILMKLINLRYDDGEESMSKFLQGLIWGKFEQQQREDIKQQLKENPPLHLLEAFHMVLVLHKSPRDTYKQVQVYIDEKGDIDLSKPHKTFRSAKDLKAKGIHFKANNKKSLRAIKFNSFTFYGQLELPTWFLSSVSKVFFLNMIAYELCPNNLFDTTVISFISFMKSLIVSAADVKELREKRILLTSFTSDEDVVRLFRDLNTYETTITDNYLEVKQMIQDHYDSKAKTWMAQLLYTYFNSPWSVIAWFAGVVLLVLTIIQTYYTVNSKS